MIIFISGGFSNIAPLLSCIYFHSTNVSEHLHISKKRPSYRMVQNNVGTYLNKTNILGIGFIIINVCPTRSK